MAESILGSVVGSVASRLARRMLGDGWEAQVASGLAFARRRLAGEYAVDELGFDAELTDALFLPVLRAIAQGWFRVQVRGIENIPSDGGALIVANHSGTLPWDGLITQALVHRDHPEHRHVRMLGADVVFATPVAADLARKTGTTLACAPDADRLLGSGELVVVFPEGFKGIGKPYGERYKLQRFGRGGFVSAALRTGVPIVPCSIVGAEETYPMLGSIDPLARLLGLPYVPVTPTFPWLGPLGLVPLPSKWLVEFGTPIATQPMPDERDPDDPMVVFELTDRVRETIQQTLYALLLERRSPWSS